MEKIIRFGGDNPLILEAENKFIKEAAPIFTELESLFLKSFDLPRNGRWVKGFYEMPGEDEMYFSPIARVRFRQKVLIAQLEAIANNHGIGGEWKQYPPLITSIIIKGKPQL